MSEAVGGETTSVLIRNYIRCPAGHATVRLVGIRRAGMMVVSCLTCGAREEIRPEKRGIPREAWSR